MAVTLYCRKYAGEKKKEFLWCCENVSCKYGESTDNFLDHVLKRLMWSYTINCLNIV